MISGQFTWDIDVDGLELFEEISPDAGDPLCLCSKCQQVIGAREDDPRWDDHEDACSGCDLCTPPIRLWKTQESDSERMTIVGEYRFHYSCFEQVQARGVVQ